jgi:hypothetical protein
MDRRVSPWDYSPFGKDFCFLTALVPAKLPYPMWFKVVNLIAIPAAIYLGLRSASRRKSTAVSSAK